MQLNGDFSSANERKELKFSPCWLLSNGFYILKRRQKFFHLVLIRTSRRLQANKRFISFLERNLERTDCAEITFYNNSREKEPNERSLN